MAKISLKDRIYLHTHGHLRGQKEEARNLILRNVGRGFRHGIKPLAKPIVQQLGKIARRQGIGGYLPYLWWVLYRQQGSWPSIPSRNLLALRVSLSLVNEESQIPSYTKNFRPLPEHLEDVADDALRAFASWCALWVVARAGVAYIKALRAWGPKMREHYPEKFASDKEAIDQMEVWMRFAIHKFPAWFEDPWIQTDFVLHLF